jgi:type I restriction enzyme S subunit
MQYNQYKDLQDVSLGWIDNQPSHWDVKRLRFVLNSNPVKSEVANIEDDVLVSFVPMEAVGENGGMKLELLKPISEVYSGYTYFQDGDVVVAKITPCFENGKGAIARNLENGVGFGTTEFHVLRADEEIEEKYLFYITLSHAFREIGSSEMLGAGGQKRIPEEFIKDFRLGIPTLEEQQKIAAFLDHKTQQIDQLIEKKKALIEKLEEKRIAVITQAVTKGLVKNAKLKPSGVDWLGDVPEHWDVRRLKFMASIENGKDYKEVEVEEGGFPVYGSGGEFRRASAYLYDGESVLFGRKGTIDKPLYVNDRFWTVDTMFYSEIAPNTVPMFLYYSALTFQYQKLATQTALPSITQRDLENYLLCYPDIKAQEEIVLFLDEKCKKIDEMLEVNSRTMAALHEYRSAIITSSVTGKIDVREVEIPRDVS